MKKKGWGKTVFKRPLGCGYNPKRWQWSLWKGLMRGEGPRAAQKHLISPGINKGLSAPWCSRSTGQGCWEDDRVRGRRWREVGRRGLQFFIRESDNKIKQRLQRCRMGDVWTCPATYGAARASRCISGHFTLLSDRTIKIWHISERKNKKRRPAMVRQQSEDTVIEEHRWGTDESSS